MTEGTEPREGLRSTKPPEGRFDRGITLSERVEGVKGPKEPNATALTEEVPDYYPYEHRKPRNAGAVWRFNYAVHHMKDMTAPQIAKELGYKTADRVHAIWRDYRKFNAIEISRTTVEDHLASAIRDYTEIDRLALKMLKEADGIEDDVKKSRAKVAALNQVRLAREAHDRCLQRAGVFQAVTKHFNIHEFRMTDEWRHIREGTLAFFQQLDTRLRKWAIRNGYSTDALPDMVKDWRAFLEDFKLPSEEEESVKNDPESLFAGEGVVDVEGEEVEDDGEG